MELTFNPFTEYEQEPRSEFKQFLLETAQRADGEIMTGIQWIRKTVNAGKMKAKQILQLLAHPPNDEEMSKIAPQADPQVDTVEKESDTKKGDALLLHEQILTNAQSVAQPTEIEAPTKRLLRIRGLPEDLQIRDFPNDPKPLLFNDFSFLIREDRWDLSCKQSNGTLEVEIKPKTSEHTKIINEQYVDTRIAELDDNGEIQLKPDSGYSTTLPLADKEGVIHRGVYSGEMETIINDKQIRTRGDAVKNIRGHEELTFFTGLSDMAEGYATRAGRVQGAYFPSIDHPNYIISIKKPLNVSFESEPGESDEVGVSQDIPLSDIISIVEVRPYAIKAGGIPLETNKGNVRPIQGTEATDNPLQLRVAYRVVPIEELTYFFNNSKK